MMKINRKKMRVIGYRLLMISIVMVTVTSCKPPKNKSSLQKSSLQIFGLKDNVVVEDENEPITLYFAYGFNNQGILQINRLSKIDFDRGQPDNPMESYVGQFGLFTSGYIMNNVDLIRKGAIKYNAFLSSDNQPVNIPNFGGLTELENDNGQQLMNLNRHLKLFEFINSMHELGKEKFGANFYSLNELKNNSEIILQKPLITLKLNIILEYETKLGKKGQNEIKLTLRPAKRLI